MEDLYVLGDGQHVVWLPQEGFQLPDERDRALALPKEVLEGLPPYAPVLAHLEARQLPYLAPPVDCGLLNPDHPGHVRDSQKLLISRCALAVFHALSPFPLLAALAAA